MNDTPVKKRTFNAVDVVLIVLVVLCFASIVLRFTVLDQLTVKRGNAEANVAFHIDCVRNSSIDELKKGQAVYLDTEKIGTLDEDLGTSVTPAKVTMTDSTGKNVTVYYPDSEFVFVNGKMTVTGTFREKEGFTLANGTHLAVGSELTIYCGSSALTVSVDSVTLVTAQNG